MERYIKIYEKAIEFGRDVGYSETDYMTFTNIEDLARSFGKHFNERYFTLIEMPIDELHETVRRILVENEKKAKLEKIDSIEEQIKKLQQQIEGLKG